MRTHTKRVRRPRSKKSLRNKKGGFFNLFSKKEYNPLFHYDSDTINLAGINDPEELDRIYKSQCPKTFLGFKNSSIDCKKIDEKRQGILKKKKDAECDPNNLVNIKTEKEMHTNYHKCCPKSYFGFKNKSPYCKQLDLNFQAAQKKKQVEYYEEPEDEVKETTQKNEKDEKDEKEDTLSDYENKPDIQYDQPKSPAESSLQRETLSPVASPETARVGGRKSRRRSKKNKKHSRRIRRR